MQAKPGAMTDEVLTQRLQSLAQRCRDLAEMTAVPEMTRELLSIAGELESEAERAGRG
jgi:hypothetical protein